MQVILVGILVGSAVFFAVAGILPSEQRTRRLLNCKQQETVYGHLKTPWRVLLEIVCGMGRLCRHILPKSYLGKCQDLLIMAGEPLGIDVYCGLGVVVLCLAMGFGLAASNWMVTFFAIILGLVSMRIWLVAMVRRRRNCISRTLPFALDLLTICGEAGLGFDSALSRYVESSDEGPLRDEFVGLLQDMRSGKSRYQALKDFAERLKSPEIDSFCLTMMQADQLGTSIGTVLRMLADQTRTRRSQQIEGLAMRAPVKMLFPLLFFVFPAVFIVFFGPILLNGLFLT
ncbi:MAG: type II secretion system F family protein [Limnochordia bacterium]|jgi:tight adherence protein C